MSFFQSVWFVTSYSSSVLLTMLTDVRKSQIYMYEMEKQRVQSTLSFQTPFQGTEYTSKMLVDIWSWLMLAMSVFLQLLKVEVALCLVGVARPELRTYLAIWACLLCCLLMQPSINVHVCKQIQEMLLKNSQRNLKEVYLLTNSFMDIWPFDKAFNYLFQNLPKGKKASQIEKLPLHAMADGWFWKHFMCQPL